MPEPEKTSLWELSDLRTPWCIHVAATLRLAERIAAGNDRIETLANEAGCDMAALHQLLGHLVSRGVFEEPAPGRFALNALAREFLDPITHLTLDLDSLGGRMAGAWSTLLRYVRTGAPAYQELFGLPFFEDLAAHPHISADFDTLIGPAGHGAPDPEFQITGGWESVGTVVEVGGGTGAMLAEMLRARPQLRGILVDQPATVARSAEIFAAAGVSERVSTSGQSFFDPLPRGGDLYLLRGIINDWPERESIAILSRCAEAAPPGGIVVVLKSVGPDDEPKELPIESLLVGGRRRTVSEFRKLAREAGLEISAAGQQASYFVVECTGLIAKDAVQT